MPEGYDLPEIFILTKIIEFWANPLFLSQIKILILFGSRRKLVISVGKRRGFSRRFWLLIKELLIARDADRRNKTPYINVSFLEFNFLESHIFLKMFVWTNKTIDFCTIPILTNCRFRLDRKKKYCPIPDAASERV